MATKIPFDQLQKLTASILSENKSDVVFLLRKHGMKVTTESPQSQIDRAFLVLNTDSASFRADFAQLAAKLLKGAGFVNFAEDPDYQYDAFLGLEKIFGGGKKKTASGGSSSNLLPININAAADAAKNASKSVELGDLSNPSGTIALQPNTITKKNNFWNGLASSITMDNLVGAVGLGLGIWGTVQQQKQQQKSEENALKMAELQLEAARMGNGSVSGQDAAAYNNGGFYPDSGMSPVLKYGLIGIGVIGVLFIGYKVINKPAPVAVPAV